MLRQIQLLEDVVEIKGDKANEGLVDIFQTALEECLNAFVVCRSRLLTLHPHFINCELMPQ